ncbi:MAG TPA: transcription termination/antitermination protein NusG [Candidatus Azoamicus sp. OHIO1]
MKKWYIVHTFSGHETKVKATLQEQIKRKDLTNFFGSILIPTENVIEMRLGKKRKSERKFFPGYLLVEMIITDETWYLVQNIPQVFGFIGGKSGNPIPITDDETQSILKKIKDSSENPKPKILFELGEMVRVIDGPFSNFNGTVEEVNYDKNRLCVGVLIFGRSTPINLDFSQVEKN